MPPKKANNKQITPTLPPIGGRGLRSHSPIGRSEYTELSEENKTLLMLFENKIETKFSELIGILEGKEEKIRSLEQVNITLKRDMRKMSDRIEYLETYERRNDVILSGTALPVRNQGENTGQVAADLLLSALKYRLPMENVVAAYRLGRPPISQHPDKRNIMLKLSSEHLKNDILNACKKVKPPKLFIGENLIASRSSILYSLRQMKKKYPDKIEFCGSRNGRVFLWIKSAGGKPPNHRVFVNTQSEMQDFCRKVFGVDVADLFPISGQE